MSKIVKLFSEIKNGFLAKKTKIIQQYSKKSIEILDILYRDGFIKKYKIETNYIIIYLKYKEKKSIITNIKYISKNNKNIYIKKKKIFKVKKENFLLTTTLGFLTIEEVKKYNIGGKFLCKFS